MSTLFKLYQILRDKSLRYILFRSKYEFERRSGLLARKFPTYPRHVILPTLEDWEKSVAKYLFGNRTTVSVTRRPSAELKAAANKVLQGEVQFFSKEWEPLGLDWDYVTNPESGYRYDANKHWTKVNDYDEVAGDIKFVWEPSRFESLYTIVRYDYHFDKDHSEFAIGRIIDWIEKNPLNCGPNYKCSQEISLRVLNWLFALVFYKNSEVLTEERWGRIIESIYWQMDHVYKNIDFSRIAVRNNHAITETMTLYLIGLLFPSFPHASKWKKNGKRWFEQEIEFQYEPEGTYLQQSMNYQRVVTQLLTLGITLAEKNGEHFSEVVYQRAYANLNFLYQMQDEKSGKLPNYGANDGAHFFQLSDADYRDYRPQLDALHHLLTGVPLYGGLLEESEWYGFSLDKKRRYIPLKYNQGVTTFENGGYYIVRENDKLLFIRCGGFKGGIPTDLMHIDVWSNGVNFLMDGGSYKYNTEDNWKLYFAGTESANCVMLDNNGQMKKGPRFMWFVPSHVIGGSLKEKENGYLFKGSVHTFRTLGEGIVWQREVHISKDLSELIVKDTVNNKPAGMMLRQIWHTESEALCFNSTGYKEVKTGWYSDYYGVKTQNKQVEFSTEGNVIETKIKTEQ